MHIKRSFSLFDIKNKTKRFLIYIKKRLNLFWKLFLFHYLFESQVFKLISVNLYPIATWFFYFIVLSFRNTYLIKTKIAINFNRFYSMSFFFYSGNYRELYTFVQELSLVFVISFLSSVLIFHKNMECCTFLKFTTQSLLWKDYLFYNILIGINWKKYVSLFFFSSFWNFLFFFWNRIFHIV